MTAPLDPFAGDDAVLEAAKLLGDKGMFAALWLDDQAIVRRTFGSLANAVEVGEHVTWSILPLVGQEDRIAALKTSDLPVLNIPNVAMMSQGDAAPSIRLNVSLFWRRETNSYLVLLGRVLSSGMSNLVLEDEIRKRRIADAELARINHQLEEFAYVISHDLKAPLRALRYYSTDIQLAFDEEPADLEAVRSAGRNIAVATKRMSNMLVGLLDYSRIGRQDETVDTVDTGAMAQDIVGNLARSDTMQIVVEGQWPQMRTTPVPLDLVLRNLVDNALKHHDRQTGTVRVICEDMPTHAVFSVADDGPGIPVDWHQAIFDPFKRIDDSKSPESSGIGLALVKRTVENAGGRIEVQSNPEIARGTTFRVTWPKR